MMCLILLGLQLLVLRFILRFFYDSRWRHNFSWRCDLFCSIYQNIAIFTLFLLWLHNLGFLLFWDNFTAWRTKLFLILLLFVRLCMRYCCTLSLSSNMFSHKLCKTCRVGAIICATNWILLALILIWRQLFQILLILQHT